jgi:hypothetical protein
MRCQGWIDTEDQIQYSSGNAGRVSDARRPLTHLLLEAASMPDSQFTVFPSFGNEPDQPRRRCRKCGAVKPLSEYHRDRITRNGFKSECKECALERQRRYQVKNKSKVSASRVAAQRKIRYGVDRYDFDDLLRKQCGRCAICKQTPQERGHNRQFHIDHDHKTNSVRGLLCHSCNLALGHFKDSIEILTAAIAYLERSSDPPESQNV